MSAHDSSEQNPASKVEQTIDYVDNEEAHADSLTGRTTLSPLTNREREKMEPLPRSTPCLDARLEQLLEDFENAWHQGPPNLGDFLPDDEAGRQILLHELVHVDLEYRYKAGEPIRVESYLERYPELVERQSELLSLLRWEYELRQRTEMADVLAELIARFPTYSDVLNSWREATVQAAEVLKTSEVAKFPDIAGYEILSLLGRGGMGVVYRARQLNLKREVALKMILAGGLAGDEERTRFRREAEAVAHLQHPNIVQIYDVDEHQGQPYFSLEFVGGGNLAGKIKGQPQPPVEAAHLVETLARAMAHAHERGVIHRDLKPANILLMPDGTPKITDFGLAKQLESDLGVTHTGAVMGTPSYMAPEQAAGKVHEVGPLADVYALGAILYEMLTGKPPFKGNSVLETLEQVRHAEPLPPSRLRPKIPRDLETICLKCLSKEPQQRYASALALANDLARCRAGEPILARRQGIVGKAAQWLHRHRRTVAVLAGVSFILTIAAFLVFSAFNTSRLATLEQDILRQLEAVDGTLEQAAVIETLIGDLEPISPHKAEEYRQRLTDRLFKFTDQQMAGSVFKGEADVQRIESMIALVQKRDGELAKQLQLRLKNRLNFWDPVFKAAAPFSQLERLFPPGSVPMREGQLMKPSPTAPPLVLTNQVCEGNTKLEAVFHVTEPVAQVEFGLLLYAADDRSYLFRVIGANPEESEQAGRKSNRFKVQILRSGALLAEKTFTIAMTKKPLSFWGRREGNHLACRLNNFPIVEFYDPFPLSSNIKGVYAVLWPQQVFLEELIGSRQLQAIEPGPLQRGDELYDNQLYAEALAYFERQAQTAGETPLTQEALYKASLCQLALRRDDEALGTLEKLASQKGDSWPVLANFQLWILCLGKQDQQSETRVSFALSQLQYRGLGAEELARLIPLEMRQHILGSLHSPRGDFFMSNDPDAQAKMIARTVDIQKLLDLNMDGYINTIERLIKAYRLAGREDDALLLGEKTLSMYPGWWNSTGSRVLEQVGWMLRLRGKASQANTWVDRFFAGLAIEQDQLHVLHYLDLERIRNLIALKNYAQAEKLTDAIIDSNKLHKHPTQAQFNAYLIKGFLREQAGDSTGALDAWRKGAILFENHLSHEPSMTPFLHYWIMASLSDSLSDAQARTLQNQLVLILGGDAGISKVVRKVIEYQPVKVYQVMWKRPHAKEVARRLAYTDLAYSETLEQPLLLLAAETFLQTALSAEPSPEQELLIRESCQIALGQFRTGKLNIFSLGLLAETYRGQAVFPWWAARATLDEPLRGRSAYLLGLRYQRLQKSTEAASFFQEALNLAQPNTPLQRQTQHELKRIEKR